MKYQQMFDEGEKSGSVHRLTPVFVPWTKAGQTIIGKLLEILPIADTTGVVKFNQYVMDTDDFIVKFQLGSVTDRSLAGFFEVGNVYRIVYEGQSDIAGGRKVNNFNIDALIVVNKDIGLNFREVM